MIIHYDVSFSPCSSFINFGVTIIFTPYFSSNGVILKEPIFSDESNMFLNFGDAIKCQTVQCDYFRTTYNLVIKGLQEC